MDTKEEGTPAYSFSVMDFVPKILDGSKPHTIRPRRKNPTKAGDVLYLYYKQRTRECRAIGVTVCKYVTPIVIYPDYEIVRIWGIQKDRRGLEILAKRDGFKNADEFMDFFKRYKKTSLLMEIVEWDPEKLVSVWDLSAEEAKELMALMTLRIRGQAPLRSGQEVDDAA